MRENRAQWKRSKHVVLLTSFSALSLGQQCFAYQFPQTSFVLEDQPGFFAWGALKINYEQKELSKSKSPRRISMRWLRAESDEYWAGVFFIYPNNQHLKTLQLWWFQEAFCILNDVVGLFLLPIILYDDVLSHYHAARKNIAFLYNEKYTGKPDHRFQYRKIQSHQFLKWILTKTKSVLFAYVFLETSPQCTQ